MASITKEMAFDSAPPEAAEVEPKAPDETPAHEGAEGEATIPIDAFGGVAPKVGDSLKVVSIDTTNGTVAVKLSSPVKAGGGIDAKAAELDEMDQTESGLTA